MALALPGARLGQAQAIDLNGNGMSDIWEQVFLAAGLGAGSDADADGLSNRQESLAGTNPFDSNSIPRITAAARAGTNFSVTLPCALGKQYQLQSASDLADGGGSNWTSEVSLVARTGTVVTLSAPVSTAARFFRVAVSDVDTDGDGVNDWEEYQLGLDPNKAASNGHLDANGQPMSDSAYVTGKLQAQNVLTISATDPIANQPDPGLSAINSGTYTVMRGGFPLNPIAVNLGLGGPGTGFATEGVDHDALPRVAVFPVGVSSQTISLTPLPNTNRMTPVLAMLKLQPGANYTLGTASNASIVIYPSQTPQGTGLTGQYFTNSSSTYSNSINFNPANLRLTRLDTNIDFLWGTTAAPITNNGYYTVRWTGQIQPQYSETYTFDTYTDDGVRLWVNDQLIIDKWVGQSHKDWTGSIDLQAGVRYNVQMDYFNGGGLAEAHLSWYSPSQSKQIVPTARCYPQTVPPSPTAVTSPLTAFAFVNQPFSYTILGANSATRYTASGLPPGLSLTAATGAIGGIPTVAGDYQVAVTASNAVGVGASVVDIQVLDTGSAVAREIWADVPGTNVTDIPLANAPTGATSLATLEGPAGSGSNYGERVRGYLTAPATGNYYFWIAASDSAELWIANDQEPVNKVRRAYVLPTPNPTPPPANGSGARQWHLQSNQKSAWLALVAGQRYYLEILHKVGAGTNGHWSVGWLQDPTGTNDTPAGVVPGYVLSRYVQPPPAYIPGTLYTANLLAQAGVSSAGVGTATLRLNTDGTQGILNFSASGLSSPVTGEHIHCDAYLNNPSQIIFDIDTAPAQPDGSRVWTIVPVGTFTNAADIVELIKQGRAYINLHTVNNPGGEINGHFTLASGTQVFTPPPAPPAWTDDHASSNAAARFLIQATFGPSPGEVASVQSLGYAAWIDNQFTLPVTYHLPVVMAKKSSDPVVPYPSSLTFNAWWQRSVTAPDQLRQRMAFALSELVVVSESGLLANNARALSDYYDTLLDNAFGNFRTLLKAVTLSPAMGLYLDLRANDMGSLITGLHANENYAREIQQLFSIGLYRLWPDGTLIMDSGGNLVPTYDQNVIMGFASVFTGWNYYQTNQANGRLPTSWFPSANYTNALVLVPTHHETGPKRLLDNVVLPAAQGSQAYSTNAAYDAYGLQEMEAAMDSLFYHPNVGPFVCRQLIQRFVTSNPSRDYLYRVVQKFNDNGAGVRGDLQAVLKAILLDYEARSPAFVSQVAYGKQREPLLRATATARAFPSPAGTGGTYSENGTQTITVTTTNAHRLGTGDTVFLDFTDTSTNAAPPDQGYSVTVTSPSTFTCSAPGLTVATYSQNNSTITISNANQGSHGLLAGYPVQLSFTTGGAPSGVYPVVATPTNYLYQVTAPDVATRSGTVLLSKYTGGGYTQSGTNITIITAYPHWLNPGDSVFINFTGGTAADGQYTVVTVPDATHFGIVSAASASQTQNSLSVYPLVAPPLVRSGLVGLQQSTWNMGATDTGASAALSQTPLRSPTVFNFFFPDYKFPGPLASAGLTTPEFQLTSDTEVALQMNFLEGALLNNTGNTNGPSSFTAGNGAIVLDLGPWMRTNYTATNTSIGSLADALNSLLLGGQLSSSARTTIVNYAANPTNFPYSSPPTVTQIRDRVRAVVHLIVSSPDFTIQK